MKLITFFSASINAAVLAAVVGFGAYHWNEAQAEQILGTVTEEQRHCLQQNIYWEARNQSDLGRQAVAWVTLNRVDSARYPDTVCDVVWQRKQFSWTHDGKSDEPGDNVLEQAAWREAGLVAERVLNQWARGRDSVVGAATHYHADYARPYWRTAYVQVAQVDNHIFYEEKG